MSLCPRASPKPCNQPLTSLQRQALQETKNVLPGMKVKIEQAVEKLEEELVSWTTHEVHKNDGIDQT